MTPEQWQNYLNWRNTTLAQAEANNYSAPLNLNQGSAIMSGGWGPIYTLPDGDNAGTKTWAPSPVSPLSQEQFNSAMQYVQQSPEEDFVDYLGRVISSGTKINVTDPTSGQSLGYYQYAPQTNEYEAMTPSQQIFAGDSAVYLNPDSYVAYRDPRFTNDYAGITKEWAWNPVEGAPERTQADLQSALQGAGITPQEQFGGTIGKGGWSAIRGMFGTLIGPALAAAAAPTSEAAMVGLSEATGIAPGTAETIVNATQGAGMGAVKGAMGGNPFVGAISGGIGAGVTSETGSSALGQAAGSLTSAGLNYLNQPSAQSSAPSSGLSGVQTPNITTVQPQAGSTARPITYVNYGSPVGYGVTGQSLSAAATSPVGYGVSNYLR